MVPEEFGTETLTDDALGHVGCGLLHGSDLFTRTLQILDQIRSLEAS